MPKLTTALIKDAEIRDKDYIIWDNQISGFGCRIYPSKQKTYVFRYTSPVDKKRQTFRLGDFKSTELSDARNTAKKIEIDLFCRIDPFQTKKQIAQEDKYNILFKDFWDIFFQEYINKQWKKSSIYASLANFRRICDYFGEFKLNDIESSHITSFRDSICYKNQSTLCLSYLSVLFNYAKLMKYLKQERNPCEGIKKYPIKQKQRFLSAEEFKKIENTFDELLRYNKYTENKILVLYFILYSGQRKSEIMNIKWSDIDLENKIIHLIDSKTGKRDFYINDQMLKILNKSKNENPNTYVFSRKDGNDPVGDPSYIWRVIRNKLGLGDVRIHDFRHTYASLAARNRVPITHLKDLLGHKNINTTMRYVHLYTEDLVKAANEVFK